MLLSFSSEESTDGVTAPERSAFAERMSLHLDAGGDTSLSRQIVDRIWVDVISGALETGERLPTVRQLAIDLGLNPKTVDVAYEELKNLGVVTDRPGEGTFVSLNAPNADERERRLAIEAKFGADVRFHWGHKIPSEAVPTVRKHLKRGFPRYEQYVKARKRFDPHGRFLTSWQQTLLRDKP